MRFGVTMVAFACALVAFGAPLAGGSASPANGPSDCRTRANGTVAKLEECIRKTELWGELAQFQRIADENPGPNGHGNRDTGTPGYLASVNHVARLMRDAGYDVTIQQYNWRSSEVDGTPQFGTREGSYAFERDWFVARRSAGGSVTALVVPPRGSADGCDRGDFAGFPRGDVALLERGDCSVDAQVANAEAAGAGAAIVYDDDGGGAYEARLSEPAAVPVIGVAAYVVGADLLRRYRSGVRAIVHIDVRLRPISGIDYNLIADSPYGDANHLVAIDAHLDSIYGAGMLDNASGSATILDIALSLAKTPTRNRLRYIWFGGEELGLLGSHYYTTHISRADLRKILFDVDVDVTATPNYDILVADPANAFNAGHFPKNVVPQSKIGNDLFAEFFAQHGALSQPARFGNDGTDSNSFSLVGTPNSGILTQQDCCKHAWETSIWGGYLGNYEGLIPNFNGGCVDFPHRWCDNLSNNDADLLEFVGQSVAYVTLELANARLR